MVVYAVSGVCIAVGALILVIVTFMNTPERQADLDKIDRIKE